MSHGGLANIRDRVAALRGTVRVSANAPSGTTVLVDLPVDGIGRSAAGGGGPRWMSPGALRVVIAEDNYLVREGVRRLLEDSGEVDVVASVGSGVELLDAVRRLSPHAVLTDIRMPPGHHMEGIEAAHAIRASSPSTGVVVLSQHADESYALALFADGSAGLGYLLKDRIGDLEDLVHALREVCAGGSVVDPQIVDTLVRRRSAAGRRVRCRRSRRASSMCCARWPRARRTPASSRRCSCPRRPWRSM